MAGRWMKKASGIKSGSGILVTGHSHYFGFVLKTGGTDKTFKAYNALTNTAGMEVEDMVCDGDKPSDGHSHADPVLCHNGIYYEIQSGATAVIYYWDEF